MYTYIHRQHTSAFVSIRRNLTAYGSGHRPLALASLSYFASTCVFVFSFSFSHRPLSLGSLFHFGSLHTCVFPAATPASASLLSLLSY